MRTTSLTPFSPPSFLAYGQSSSTVLLLLLSVVIFFWLIYTLVAIYHWMKYSHASWVSFPAIVAHFVVSFLLASYAFSGFL